MHAQPIQFEKREKISRLFESDRARFIRNFDEACAYHHRAQLFAQEGTRASLIFNVASIAIECYMIALCAHFKNMPSNHSFGNLVDDVKLLMDFPADLAGKICGLDRIFGICSLDNYFHGTPTEADADISLEICAALQRLITDLSTANPLPMADDPL